MVVVLKPVIQVVLQFLDGSVKLVSEGFPEELIEDRAVEALYESIKEMLEDFDVEVLDLLNSESMW